MAYCEITSARPWSSRSNKTTTARPWSTHRRSLLLNLKF